MSDELEKFNLNNGEETENKEEDHKVIDQSQLNDQLINNIEDNNQESNAEDKGTVEQEELSYQFWAETEQAIKERFAEEYVDSDVVDSENKGQVEQEDNGISTYDSANQNPSSYRLKYEEIFNNKEVDEAFYRENHNLNAQEASEEDEQYKVKGKKIVKFIATAAAFGIIAGCTFIGVTYVGHKLNPDFSVTTLSKGNDALTVTTRGANDVKTTTVTNGSTNATTDVSTLVEDSMPSIVSIKSSITETVNDFFGNAYEEEAEGSGSGIIVGKNDTELLIATNNHVVEGAKTIKVTFVDNKEVTAEIKGKDSTADLAVIAVKLSDLSDDTSAKIKIAVLGDSENVKVGQMAVAIGNALGYGQSVTVGYISAKDREVQISESQTMVLLQTDAAINPGNSGGALLNIEGEVIGINSAKTAANEVEGMGYAIPISKATPIINDLMNRETISEEEQGYLGITGADITEAEVEKFNMPIGVSIGTVVEDGPADKAGIKQGDIITKVDDAEITSFTQLKEKVNSNKVGTELEITYMRSDNGEYKEHQVKVTLAAKPDDSQIPGYSTTPNDNSTDNNSGDNNSDNSMDGIEDFFNFGN